MELIQIFKGEYQTKLSDNTIKKAKGLAKKIQLEDQSWLVPSSSKNGWYLVKYDELKKQLYCCNGIDNSICEGWKFLKGKQKDCKHCLAVRIFNGQTVTHLD